MVSTAVRCVAVKQQDTDQAQEVVVDHLEELARQGARQMLVTALQEEIGFWGHHTHFVKV